MPLEREPFFSEYDYRAQCPACPWAGEWRATKDHAHHDLEMHKNRDHYCQELILPSDFETQATDWRTRAVEAERVVHSYLEANRLLRLQKLRLEQTIARCRKALGHLDMAYLADSQDAPGRPQDSIIAFGGMECKKADNVEARWPSV